ncbi:MAG: sensor histidine kinase [Thaumarchaeota archaeon]|nr:sensor histidine kinase [Nitrososphaerota archaeon]
MVNYSTNTLVISTLVLVAVIPILVFGAYSLDDEKKAIERQQLTNLREIVDSQKDKTMIFFNERLADISVTSELPFIRDNIHVLFENDSEKDIQTKESLQSLFRNILNAYNYESIWVVDNDLNAKLIVGRDIADLKPLPSPSSALEQMKVGLYLSDVYTYTDDVVEVFVSVPIVVDDIQLGYLIYDIDTQLFFKATLFELQLSDTGETVVVQKQNDDVFFIKQLRFDDARPLSKPISTDAELAIPALESSSGISGFGFSTDYRGEEILAAWDYVPLTRWGIVAKIDTSEAFASLEQKQRDIIIVIISLTVSAFVAGFVLSRIATNPLMKIRDAATQITKKNYDVAINPTGPAEQKTIAISFNEMAKSLKENQKIIESQIAQLKLTDKQKSEFSTMISHELKTPLSTIIGYSEMLKDPKMGELNKEQEIAIDEIRQSSVSLEHLIGNILTAQKIEQAQLSFNIEKTSVKKLLKQAYNRLLPLMSEKQIEFLTSTEEDIVINIDKEIMMEVFSNLVQNSVDFVPASGGRIEMTGHSKNSDVLFSVIDNGIGIPKKKLRNLFKKYYQIDTSMTRKHGGSGLGLAICKGIIEGFGGKIWVESEEGKRTIIYFTIPKKSGIK